jgi:YD repeat-containing protein
VTLPDLSEVTALTYDAAGNLYYRYRS